MPQQLKSTYDMVHLVAELYERRINEVFKRWFRRINGRSLRDVADAQSLKDRMTDEEVAALGAVTLLRHRFARGQYWHTEREQSQVQLFCRFLVSVHAQLNHTSPKPFVMDHKAMYGAEEIEAGAYEQAVYNVKSGVLDGGGA